MGNSDRPPRLWGDVWGFWHMWIWLIVLACTSSSADPVDTDDGPGWALPAEELGGAVLSITGTAWDDVWVAGADDGAGPLVAHHDGTSWTRLDAGSPGDAWWVWQPPVAWSPVHPVWVVGDAGRVLRFDGASWDEAVTDPQITLFGLWGAAEDDVWTVGGDITGAGRASIYHFDGATWTAATLPEDVAAGLAIYKVWGAASDDVWACGTDGVILHWDGLAWTRVESGTSTLLLTVAGGAANDVYAVGGYGNATVLHYDGVAWSDESPEFTPDMNGVFVRDGAAAIVGRTGAVYERDDAGWSADPRGVPAYLDLHATWIDPDGAVWAVGGAFSQLPMVRGLIAYGGDRPVAPWTP